MIFEKYVSGYSPMLVYFAAYSFLGWALEVVYRSYRARRFINPGLLHGPFLPVYGSALTLMLYVREFFPSIPLPLEAVVCAAAATGVEYAAGFLLEKLFGMRLWDYSDERYNLHGRVCVKYSLFWTAGALALTRLVHPLVERQVRGLPADLMVSIVTALSAYFVIDMSFSAVNLRRFHGRLVYLAEHYLALSAAEIQSLTGKMKRILGSFPYLEKQLGQRLRQRFIETLSGRLNEFRDDLQAFVDSKKPRGGEFRAIIADILANEEFQKLRNFRHHTTSIYAHALTVSYLSYRVAKHLGLDYRAATRGALLHDFFLYDWRRDADRPYENGMHGFKHPMVALDNARKNFSLSTMEEDIIKKHMWPLTITPPRYRESFIVSFVDKYVASKEFAGVLFPNGRRRLKKKRRAR